MTDKDYVCRQSLVENLKHFAPEHYTALLDLLVTKEPTANVIEVTEDYREGDVCLYSFHEKNKSFSVVEIVRILDDPRGVAEIKFLKVFVDDTGNDYFTYLLRTGKTMNASLKYLKNITPRVCNPKED